MSFLVNLFSAKYKVSFLNFINFMAQGRLFLRNFALCGVASNLVTAMNLCLKLKYYKMFGRNGT